MTLDVVFSEDTSKRNARQRLHFKCCPICGCIELIDFGPDTFCSECDWDSCEAYVKAGLMDDRMTAYREHFNRSNKITVRANPRPTKTAKANTSHRANLNLDEKLNRAHETFFKRAVGDR